MNRTTYVEEIELNVEEMEAVIAPMAMTQNHNETVEVELCFEEMEAVVAPGLQHNETLISDVL